ncbi:MAG: hypothetical protein OSJ46_09070 [Duncaniella sp.]|nr:hypothetical protein [Duncaniella sp.]HBI58766.1 hypothetical protein [Porphyromonadaceae bacterium]
MNEFDEKQAIAAMNASIAGSGKQYDEDELLNIIDMIWDWYEDNGLLEIDTEADDEEVNVDALVKYVKKMLARDSDAQIDQADVEVLVMAELNYEQSL